MNEFAEILEQWYAGHGRYDLPWRQTDDPYRIWISEIILQQTRVAQGFDYYERFIRRFPDVFSLAAAQEDEVLKLWQGLGYYSRARNLHAAAMTIARLGHFPTDYAGVRALKGIGDYTAAAVCSFAYHQPYAVVDGNVYRVLSRIFGLSTPIDSNTGKKEFAAMANELLDRQQPHVYNSAIMDFGALQCTPKSPDCSTCPFADRCAAFQHDLVDVLPVKAKKTAVSERFFVYVCIEDEDCLLLHRREKGDIWQGLYEPFLIEFKARPTDVEVMQQMAVLSPEKGGLRLVTRGMKHQLTHRTLWIDCYQLTVGHLPQLDGFIAVPKSGREAYATPKPVTLLLDKLSSHS